MKKFKLLTALLIGVLAVAMAGCGEEIEKNLPNKDKLEVGVITHLNASEEKYSELMKGLEQSYRPSKETKTMNYHYYNNLNEMQMALKSNQIDLISTYQFVAAYMTGRDNTLDIVPPDKNLEDSFCFAVKGDNTELLSQFDNAISEMTADRTMANIAEQYITNVTRGEEPKAVSIAEIAGAETLKVAVTGDLPPFDMMTADGTPTGYSTAVMAEISKRIGKNIEFVSVDSAARATALVSNKVDVVFWVAVPNDDKLVPGNIDTPEGLALSKPYYVESITYIALKK